MIFRFKTDLMRKLLQSVSHGYHYWTAGTVQPTKALALIHKFDDRYETQASAQQRYRNKRRGASNAELSMWPEPDGLVYWWLTVTEGDGLVHDLERLRDARNKRNRITLTGYELVKTPRKDRRPQWSWRITKKNYENWQYRLQTAIRRNSDSEIRQALHSLCRVPGFHESRRQAFRLASYARAEWNRAQRGPWPFGAVFIGWIGPFKRPRTIDPADLAKRAKAGRHR